MSFRGWAEESWDRPTKIYHIKDLAGLIRGDSGEEEAILADGETLEGLEVGAKVFHELDRILGLFPELQVAINTGGDHKISPRGMKPTG